MRNRYQSPHYKGMNSRRLFLLFLEWVPIALTMALIIASPKQAYAQDKELNTPSRVEKKYEGKTVAEELSPEIKRAIDAIRKLQETPGLILDLSEIYRVLDVRSISSRTIRSSNGDRNMGEFAESTKNDESLLWEIRASYFEYSESSSWSAKIEIDFTKGKQCYSSRLVEAYWGQPFVYTPMGVHALMDELAGRVNGHSIGPHDGVPYVAEFRSLHPNSANVFFWIGAGGCMTNLAASHLFKIQEYSDDRFYHE
jgi:hypothetical protein